MVIITASVNESVILDIFEKCWEDLLKDYPTNRLLNLYCSEGDVQLHLANKLLHEVPFPYSVHSELPIPVEIEDFRWDLFTFGRPKRKRKKGRCIVADIVLRNLDNVAPVIIAEMKYDPYQWNLVPIIEAIEGRPTYEIKDVKDAVQSAIGRLETLQRKGPTRTELDYFLRNVSKTVQIAKDFREKKNESLYIYLCVIDEIYPDLRQRLEMETQKYNPPNQFKLRVKYYPMKKWMMEQLERLCAL